MGILKKTYLKLQVKKIYSSIEKNQKFKKGVEGLL